MERHIKTNLNNLVPGDHIYFPRFAILDCLGVLDHHAIYIGNGEVIHFFSEGYNKSEARIRQDSITLAQGSSNIYVVQYGSSVNSKNKIVSKAQYALKYYIDNDYNLFLNNCAQKFLRISYT